MRISVIGTGYVGLVAGTCFAETGNHVICVDIVEEKVKKLQSGIVTIFEPGLEVLFKRNLKEGRLHFTTDLADAVANTDVIFLALPTPPDEDGSADLKYVLGAARDIGTLMTGYKVLVDKSTVPVGTADKVRAAVTAALAARGATVAFDVVSNPEFLREGVAVDDFLKPERVVIGSSSERATAVMKELYEPFVRSGNPIIVMDEKSAELTKYAANSMLALKISFMNEVANLCERVGANVDMVRRGIGTDSRIGNRFLFAGIGYGGSCFPKDVKALVKTSDDYGYDFKILKSVEVVNDTQKHFFIPRIEKYFGGKVSDKKIALWGLAFKPNTDDVREAPALIMIDELLKRGARISAYDPEAMHHVKQSHVGKVEFTETDYDALKDADALIVATEWNEFRNPDFEQMKTLMKGRAVFDGRNIYDGQKMKALGFDYFSVGRP